MAPPTYVEDGFGDLAMPCSAAAAQAEATALAQAQSDEQGMSEAEQAEREIAAIRAEGLTGRQLRMARRIAQKNGLTPASDFDAVRLLRARCLDPFASSNMLDMVVNTARGGEAEGGGTAAAMLPATTRPVQPPAKPDAPRPIGAEERAAEIMKVQRDIARRRRRRLVLLATRLSVFVLLPTLLVAFYYFLVATPLYATNTEFVIQKAESGGSSSAGGLGGLLGCTSFATVQESIVVQSYLESREAMLRLDEELNFRAHF